MGRIWEQVPWTIGLVITFFILVSATSALHEMTAGIILIVALLASIFIRLGRLK